MRLTLFALLTTVFMTGGKMVDAQESAAPKTMSIQQLLSLDDKELQSEPMTVRTEGIVLGVSTIYPLFHLHHEGDGIWIRMKNGETFPAQGDSVEVIGRATPSNSGGRRSVMIAADSIRSLGQKPLPEPRPILITDLENASSLDVWASLEAYVVQWKYKAPDLTVKLASKDGFTDAVITVPDSSGIPSQFFGAKLRLSGLMTVTQAMGRTFFVPSLKQMQILQPGTKEWYDAAEAPLDDVVQRKVALGRRLRVRGVLATLREKWDVVITSGQNALIAALQEAPDHNEKGVIYGDAGPLPALQPGDEVEVVGTVLGTNSQERHPYSLHASSIRVVGKGKPPTPAVLRLDQMAKLGNEDRWASVEAVVTGWMHQSGMLTLTLADGTGVGRAQVRGWKTSIPSDLRGALVRVTGVCRVPQSRNRDFMTVPGHSFVTLLHAGPTDPFSTAEILPEQLLKTTKAKPVMVRTRGTLLADEGDGVLYVRGKQGAFKAELQVPFSRGNLPRGAQHADGGEWPALKPGDEVELVGCAMAQGLPRTDSGADLVECQARVLGHGQEPVPLATTLKAVAEGAHTSEWVEVRGRLLSKQKSPSSGRQWRSNLMLTSGGVSLFASYLGNEQNPFPSLRIDDDVLVRAVVSRETERSQRQLRVISVNHIKSLGLSPTVWRKQVWYWTAGGTVVAAVLLAWIANLRRRQKMQAESAQLLEQKVNERTAELRQTQAELHKALAQERELSELKTRFVSMVSHEFRTPLGVIMSSVELLKHYSKRLPDEEKERQLDDIYASTKHMGGLMEQVLLLGRVEAGKLSCKPHSLDVALLAGKIVDEVLSYTTEKCPITVQVEGGMPEAMADDTLLRHILNNLVTNAVKYSPEGRPVTVEFSKDGSDIVIRVIDRGIGIPEEDRVRLFEAFYRGSNVGEIPGTGLGLVIVKRCVDMHGGSLNVDSTPGSGTTFTVRLPVFPSA